MFFATLLLAGSFTFSHNNGTIISGKDAWTFTLQNANVGDTLEVVAYKDGVNFGKLLLCKIQSGSSCFASAVPQTSDIGLWAGDVLINGTRAGDFVVWVTQNSNCEIPSWIFILGAKYPCWTLERVRSQYVEAEANVEFSRWIMDLPFSKSVLEDEFAIFPNLAIVEHPDVFMVGGSPAAGVFKLQNIHVIGWDQIEYSLKHETTILPMVLMHEFGHKRELDEEKKYTPNAIFNTFGWWHFGHGDFLDPLVKAVNQVKNWFFRKMPSTHSYYPGQVGHEPISGSPGSFPPVFPPTGIPENIFANYYFEYDEKTAACILRPR